MTLRLFLLNPSTVFAARVNQASFSYPLTEVTFDGVTTGAYGDILPGMTVLFGSTAGADDLGRQRARKFAAADTLYFGRSSQGSFDGEVNPTDNAYITVLDDFRVWAKVPFIADDGTMYKDTDLEVGDWTENPAPVSNIGPGLIATIGDGDIITVNFDGTNSFAVGDGETISAYLWDVGDGTITVGTSASSSITATFPAGFRWVSLKVTSSNGHNHTAYCPVVARDPDDDICIDAFEITSHRITPRGQTISVRVLEEIPEDTYPDGTLVMIADDEPADADDRSHMMFIGWHQTDPASIAGNRTGTLRDVVLNCIDAAGRLDELPGFAQVIKADATPTTWTEMVAPNIDKYLHYLLYWHAAVLHVADWYDSGLGDTFPFVEIGSENASLLDQVDWHCRSLTPDYILTCNTLGQLRVIVDPMQQDSADRTATVQATLDGDDYSALRYTHQRSPRVHWLYADALKAITELPVDGNWPLYFCRAPGLAPGQGGSSQHHSEKIALSQSDLNSCEGHRYARLNAPESSFQVTFSLGDDLNIEPADLTWVKLSIDSAVAAQRGLAFTEARGLPLELNIRYDSRREGLIRTVDMTWERETSGLPAVTITYPDIVPVGEQPESGDEGEYATESFENELHSGQEVVAIIGTPGLATGADDTTDIYVTSNFQSSPPTWTLQTCTWTGGSEEDILSFIVDPFSPGYRGTAGGDINGWITTSSGIWRLTDMFGSPEFTLVKSFAQSANIAEGELPVIGASFGRYQATESDNPWLICVRPRYGTDPGVYVTYSVDGGQTWSTETRVTTHYETSSSYAWRHSDVWLSPRTPGLAYIGVFTSSPGSPSSAPAEIYKTTDWGATWTGTGITLTAGLGYSFHVPWQDNLDESVFYFTDNERTATNQMDDWEQMRGASDLTPTDSGISFAALDPQFGIRSLDTNRLYLVMNGIGWDTSLGELFYASFVSDDGGATWTLVNGPVQDGAGTRDEYSQGAFGAGNSNVIFFWGRDGSLGYSSDNGATIEDKNSASAFSMDVIGIAGGPTS